MDIQGDVKNETYTPDFCIPQGASLRVEISPRAFSAHNYYAKPHYRPSVTNIWDPFLVEQRTAQDQ